MPMWMRQKQRQVKAMESEPILRDAFDKWALGHGIFEFFTEAPWYSETSPLLLDLEYFGNRSGAKFCAPLIKYYLEDGSLSDIERETLAKIIWLKYKTPWERLWLTNSVEYNPVYNYDITEDIQRDLETEESGEAKSTNQREMTNNEELNITDVMKGSRYGFNSSSASPTDNTVEEKSASDDETEAQKDTGESETSSNGTEAETTKTHRYGNAGVTTSQKMVSEERQLWLWNYFEAVFKDIDEVLALDIYDVCRV